MAGIGFDLRKIFQNNIKLEKFKVSIYSLFITSGPLILSILVILSLKILWGVLLNKNDFNIFINIIIYTFVFGLILTAPFINLATRYISDLIYFKKEREIFSVFITGAILISIISFFIVYFYINKFSMLQKYNFKISFLFIFLNLLFFIMTFLSILKNPQKIFFAFFSGIVAVIILTLFTSKNLNGMLFSFSAGIFVTFIYLTILIFKELRWNNRIDLKWLLKFKFYPIAAGSFFLFSGMWCDKIIFWFFSNKSISFVKGFYLFPIYDFAIFISYITIIPTTAFFVIFIETKFFETQKNYLNALKKETLDNITKKEQYLVKTFEKAILKIIFFQICVDLLFFLIISTFHYFFNIYLSPFNILIITIVSANLQIILNIIFIFFYYFDYQKETFLISLLFFTINFITAFFLKDMSLKYIAIPYFLSLFITNFIAYLIAKKKLKNTTYFMLMKYS